MQKTEQIKLYRNTKSMLGVEIYNYQWNVLLLNISKIQLIQVKI